MQPLNIVVAHNDSAAAAQLAASLHHHFRSVSVARSLDEVRSAIPRNRPELAVVDLETISLPEVEKLCREFRGVPIVCTHRLPDEQMWAAALAAGALDVCQTNDVQSILLAVRRNLEMAQSNAA
jgi:DNA-binding response OmpR family regulator